MRIGKNRHIKVVMNTEKERNRILSNARYLKDIPEYKNYQLYGRLQNYLKTNDQRLVRQRQEEK